jgi:capsid protein
MISNDWSGLSFAGGRLVLTNAKLFVQAQQELLIEMWFSQIWHRLVYEAVTVGACSIPPRLYSRSPWWFQKHEWNPPAWSYSITPREEVDADLAEINGNLATKASKIAARGGDYADVFRQREKERADEKDRGIEPAAAEVPAATLEQQVEQQNQTTGAA